MYPLGHPPHLETKFIRKRNVDFGDLGSRRFRKSATLPVTAGNTVVTLHPGVARSVGAGDDVDLAADPSVSGETRRTRAALGSSGRFAAIGSGEARGVVVARGRWPCQRWHYGITGITARDE